MAKRLTSNTVALSYMGLRESELVSIEYDEFGDERLAASIAAAETSVDALVDQMTFVTIGRGPTGHHDRSDE